ncbi:MAG: phasin family protein [Pseudomonadota bacterium]
MTETAAKAAPKTAAKTKAAAETVVESATDRATQFADNARDVAHRAAEVARKRTDGALESATDFNKGLETTLTRFVGGYVSILNGMAEITHENARHAIAATEKLVEAKSLSEAAQIQAEYVRESATQNFEHARTAYEKARDVVVEETEGLRTRASDMWNGASKAA